MVQSSRIDDLPEGQVMTASAGVTAVCMIHSKAHGFTALDNRCPHQGGPLGEGQLGPIPTGDPHQEWVIYPWHGYEYEPASGEAPDGYGDAVSLKETLDTGQHVLLVFLRHLG
jgi:pyruvate oxidase